MRRYRVPIVIGALVLLFIGAGIVWPMIDRELMRIPMTDGVSALRKRDIPALRQCFTPDAVLGVGDFQVPVATVLDVVEAQLSQYGEMGSFRFGGYANAQRQGGTVTADFTVIVYLRHEENPYQGSLPASKTGQVVLKKQGLFTWKIARIAVQNDDLFGDKADDILPPLRGE